MNRIGKWIAICSVISLVGIIALITIMLGSKEHRLNEIAAAKQQVETCTGNGDYEGAVRALDKLISNSPEDEDLLFQRGLMKVDKLKQFDNGVRDIDLAIKIAKNKHSIFAYAYQTLLALAYYKSGNYAKGKEIFKETTAKIANASINNKVAWILATYPDAAGRDGKLAIQCATTACESSEWKRPAEIDTLAAAYAADGNFSEAIRWQQTAIQLNTDQTRMSEYTNHLQCYQAGQVYVETPH